MALTNEELQQSCKDNDIWCLACGQDYMATLEDVLADNPDLDRESQAAREITMSRMLEETVNFGQLDEVFDTEDNHPERLEQRWNILEELASSWVLEDYTGHEGVSELEACQMDCDRLVAAALEA